MLVLARLTELRIEAVNAAKVDSCIDKIITESRMINTIIMYGYLSIKSDSLGVSDIDLILLFLW